MLSVGPVSLNCVDAVIDAAQICPFPLTLIASRRQVDAESFGGGYVESWRTPDYVSYVRQKDLKGYVVLGRDHAGPWQNEDFRLTLNEAMDSAKKSLAVDIESGIQFIHLDPSLDPRGIPPPEEILNRVFELYGFCSKLARSMGKNVEFEVGPFSNDLIDGLELIEFVLKRLSQYCQDNNFSMPLYLVVNTGTKVMETRNVGCFDPMLSLSDGVLSEKVKALIGVCQRHQIFLKEHNTDYLSERALWEHPALGIPSANIAPELGVLETGALLGLFQKTGRQDLYDEFVTLAVDSLKWKKWMLPGSLLSRENMAGIAGHYIFSHPKGVQIRQQVGRQLQEQGINLDAHLKACVRSRIEKYLRCFGLIPV